LYIWTPGVILSVRPASIQRPSRADVAPSTSPQKKKKKNLNFWMDDKNTRGFFSPHFAHPAHFSPSRSRSSLAPVRVSDPSIPRLSLSLSPSVASRRASLSPPPSRLALSHSSDSSPATQPGRKADPNQRQFSGDPRCPVPRRPKPLQDSPATPNGNTASISVFFFFPGFILFILFNQREFSGDPRCGNYERCHNSRGWSSSPF
jgi:hypothetical protein